MTNRLLILGASGDLTSRYLIPALCDLEQAGKLPPDFRVLGFAREQWSTTQFRAKVSTRLREHASNIPSSVRRAVTASLDYYSADVTSGEALGRVLGTLDEPVVAYLALPPSIFMETVQALEEVGLPGGSKVVIEKPFGEGLASAQRLNGVLQRSFSEDSIFRIDHFLGMQTVQNILGLRFANAVFESTWNQEHISRVEITWDETLALEGRSYYDGVGALKDMVQSHLLQLLCLVAMERPLSFSQRHFRDRKVETLRSVHKLGLDEVNQATVRGRYGKGTIADREVRAYVDEEGTDASRNTETFVQVTLGLSSPRWSGVPFVLRTGKALAKNRFEIAVHFERPPYLSFGQMHEPEANVLRCFIDPDRLVLGLNVNSPGDLFDLEPIELQADLARQTLPAYARLILDVLAGDPTLSIRGDEAEESWRIVDPILEAWRMGASPLSEYPAGSQQVI